MGKAQNGLHKVKDLEHGIPVDSQHVTDQG